MFMVGSSRGLLHCGMDMSMRWSSPWGPGHYYNNSQKFRDIFAVDFQPDHPEVVLFGGRPGYLFAGDTRQKANLWHKLALKNTITHIKPLTEHQVLVSGLQSMLCVYDLRYTTRYKSSSFEVPAAVPLFRVDGYQNAAHINIGLDVDKASGIVAAAHDDGRVALYSTRTGKRLKSRDVDRIRSRYRAIHCVQFEPFSTDATPTLFVGEQSNISAYSFGVDNIDDEA